MDIMKFDPEAGLEEARLMLEGKEEAWRSLLFTLGKWNEGAFIVRDGHAPAGILSLRKYTGTIAALMFIYVEEKYRRRGIGSELLRLSDGIISDSAYEQTLCKFAADEGAAQFLTKSGYRLYCSHYEMEREPTLLDGDNLSAAALRDRGIVIRNYTDDDYMGYHNVSDIAFYLLREKVGLKPHFYQQPSETERKKLAGVSKSRYVLVDNGAVAAIGALGENEISLLAVRPDLQARGYGRIMASYLNNKIINEQHPDKVKIGVIFGNPAKRLYEKLGFHDVGTAYEFAKYYKPESRPESPKGYDGEAEILRDLKLYGTLKEEMTP